MEVLWQPTKQRVDQSNMMAFIAWVNKQYGLNLKDYGQLYEWSVSSCECFWKSLFDYFELIYEGSLDPVCKDMGFDEYAWFDSVKLNFAQNLLSKGEPEQIAIDYVHETGIQKQYTFDQLRQEVACFNHLFAKTIQSGDVVAAYMPNVPETLISMLAATSLGAVFTSTSSDFGAAGVIDRFSQSKPKILVAALGYTYNGKYYDNTDVIEQILDQVPSIEKLVYVDLLSGKGKGKGKGEGQGEIKNERKGEASFSIDATAWHQVNKSDEMAIEFKKVPFSSPLYIMYSSGTTGKPKCIVHSVGGVLIQHFKELALHTDVKSGTGICFFTTCGWMMWNWLVSSIGLGARVILYEGSPSYPTIEAYWQFISDTKVQIMGTSPKFLSATEKFLQDRSLNVGLTELETILSTGSPLLPEQFDFVYQNIKQDVLLASISGGTDIVSCFMLGNPILPVYKGLLQCKGLGMAVKSFDDHGKEVEGEAGELVCTQSFPSRPICFLNDVDKQKINAAYFDHFKGVWHHGDYIQVHSGKGIAVLGRSDATLNPGGVRIGTSEIYRQVETLDWVVDAACVAVPEQGDVSVALCVMLKQGEELSDDKIFQIKNNIKQATTIRHVPKYVFAVESIPYTRSGKKMEVVITKLLSGKAIINQEAIANIESLNEYEALYEAYFRNA